MELAVPRATQADFDHPRKCLDRSKAARSWRDFERRCAEFHEAPALATKNSAAIDILKSVNQTRGQPASETLKKKSPTRPRRTTHEPHHRAILTALTRRDAQPARKTIEQHLLAVRANLLEH